MPSTLLFVPPLFLCFSPLSTSTVPLPTLVYRLSAWPFSFPSFVRVASLLLPPYLFFLRGLFFVFFLWMLCPLSCPRAVSPPFFLPVFSPWAVFVLHLWVLALSCARAVSPLTFVPVLFPWVTSPHYLPCVSVDRCLHPPPQPLSAVHPGLISLVVHTLTLPVSLLLVPAPPRSSHTTQPIGPSTLFHHRSPLHPSIAHPHPASRPFGPTALTPVSATFYTLTAFIRSTPLPALPLPAPPDYLHFPTLSSSLPLEPHHLPSTQSVSVSFSLFPANQSF